jgi:hypothetical protein
VVRELGFVMLSDAVEPMVSVGVVQTIVLQPVVVKLVSVSVSRVWVPVVRMGIAVRTTCVVPNMVIVGMSGATVGRVVRVPMVTVSRFRQRCRSCIRLPDQQPFLLTVEEELFEHKIEMGEEVSFRPRMNGVGYK